MPAIVSGRTISLLLFYKRCRETCQEQPVTFNHCINSPDGNSNGNLGQWSAQQSNLSHCSSHNKWENSFGVAFFSTLPALRVGSQSSSVGLCSCGLGCADLDREILFCSSGLGWQGGLGRKEVAQEPQCWGCTCALLGINTEDECRLCSDEQAGPPPSQ